MHHISGHLKQCIENCSRCHQICLSMLEHCQTKGGSHAAASHLRLLGDCAEICQTSANFMLRNSPLHHLTCAACAEICNLCATECATLDSQDEHMQECARACQTCAASCQEMSHSAR